MAIRNTKSVQICVAKDGATGSALTITGVTKAKPAVVSATGATFADGDVVTFGNDATGLTEVDGKTFVIKTATGGFELVGSDTTASTGTFAAGTSASNIFQSADMQCLCFGSFSISQAGAGGDNSIAAPTFCDPTQKVASPIPSANAGGSNFSFSGYIDTQAADYAELLKLVESGDGVPMRITLPQHGYLMGVVTFDALTWDIPVDGVMGYNGSGTFTTSLQHVW